MLAATVLVACGGGSERAGDTPAATTAATPSSTPPTDATSTTDATPSISPPPGAVPTQVPGEPSDETTPSGAAVPAALQFSAPLVGGGEIELGALAGRPVLLWFWAPW
jgi:hypothetical protein